MGTLAIVFSMILVNNYVLSQFLGICPFLGVSKKLDSAVGMGGAVIFVMVLATAVTWPIQQILNRFEIGYLQTVVFILIIATVNRNDAKEIHGRPLQCTWCLPSFDHHQLRSTRRMYC